MPLITEPPRDPDDTQPCETASPFYNVPPGALYDLEQRLKDCWAALGQLDINGISIHLIEDVAFTYNQVVAERLRRDALIDPSIRFLSFNDNDKD